MPRTIKARRKEPYKQIKCPTCSTELEYLPPSEEFNIECCSCSRVFDPPKSSKQARRRVGTDSKPIDTRYYEILEVPVDAELAQIKTAYRRLALKKHPDKLTADQKTPQAEEEFKELAIAYKVLSDPEARKRYNSYGPPSMQGETGLVDPEAVFSTLFGGEKFQDIIGTVSLGQDMKSAMEKETDEEEKPVKAKKDMTPEEKAEKAEQEKKEAAERAAVREERVVKLIEALLKKISIFTEQARDGGNDPDVARSVRAIWTIETEELKNESFGVELLQAVGSVYQSKARHYSSSNSTPFGVGGWFHGIKSTAHVFSETVSTIRSAYELTDIFKELQAAEEKGLSDDKRKELEEKAATKGLQALFKGCKLEVESIIREVCDRVIYEAGISKEVQLKRVAALDILGAVYASVKKEEGISMDDYVKIDAAQKDRTPK